MAVNTTPPTAHDYERTIDQYRQRIDQLEKAIDAALAPEGRVRLMTVPHDGHEPEATCPACPHGRGGEGGVSEPTYTLAAALEAVEELADLIDPLLEVAAIDVADVHGTDYARPLVEALEPRPRRRKLARCLVERLIHDEEIALHLTQTPGPDETTDERNRP